MMSSQWVNKDVIRRDLSLAQGCVPVELDGTVEAGDKPPSQKCIEETEEELYSNWVSSDGDFGAPDIGLIKHMLEAVRNQDEPSKNEDDERIIQISKLNPLSLPYIPKGVTHEAKTKTSAKKVKPKNAKQRNVALQSLLENINKNSATQTINTAASVNLAKSTEFASKKRSPGGIEMEKKVLSWFNQPERVTSPKRDTIQLSLDPSSMFKKKNLPQHFVSHPSKEVKKTTPDVYGKFVPSNSAAEYYKMFKECARMKEIVQEDVWTKVVKQMKDIDERRKAEAELFALSLALCEEDFSDSKSQDHTIPQKREMSIEMALLPKHRHCLPGPCLVCAIRYKQNLPTNSEKINDDPCTDTSKKDPEELWKLDPMDDEEEIFSWRSEIL